LIIFVVLAIPLIVLAILYLKQRNVDFTILPPSVNDTTININPQGFEIPVNPEVEARNDNFFDVELKMITVEALHPDYGNGSVPLGKGNVTNVVLGDRATTDFTFPLLFVYNSSMDSSYTYFEHLLLNCTDPANANLYLRAAIHVDYHVWAKSGNMDLDRDVSVPCPIDTEKARQILSIVKNM
jgi:hypothetical protein